jgi:prepilin-type N-terminal cleavage/methylation domain-containing protein
MISSPQKGFTILEMLAVLAIFGVMTSVVIFNYGKFTSDTILTNMAYEVALTIREAQIYGVSVRNPVTGGIQPTSFSVPYGVHFDSGSNVYYLFADKVPVTPDGIFNNVNCVTSTECVTPYTLQRNVIISEVRKNCSPDMDGNGLNISFKRPNPEARFDNAININSSDIELTAPDGAKIYVVVRSNGQIYVTKTQPTCS